MPIYDDESIKSLDEKLRKNVAMWRNMPPEEKEALRKAMYDLAEPIKKLENMNPEDIDDELLGQIKELMPMLQTLHATVFESLFSQSYEIMMSIKAKADEGNEEAQKAYEDLYETWKKIQEPDEEQMN